MNGQPLSSVHFQEDESQEIPVRMAEKPKREGSASPRPSARPVTENERLWATIAHALGPVMLFLFFVADANFLAFLALFSTGFIYLYHRNRSAYVWQHARQALLAQLLGSVGWMLIVISGTMLWVVLFIISLLLILILIGLILAPIMLISAPFLFAATFVLPIGVGIFGALGAWKTWQGQDFRYPYVADWLDERFGKIDGGESYKVILV